jgi:predicted DNA-binding ribbon-helix-helix protein
MLTDLEQFGIHTCMSRAEARRSPPWEKALEAVEKIDNGFISRNLWVNKRRTSIRLDAVTWSLLGEVARREGLKIHELCTIIEKGKPKGLNFTVCIRRYLLVYFREAAIGRLH